MEMILLGCLFAFIAGLVDSIAGGGGLIQMPALLFLFPYFPVVTLLGTNKLASACGTVMSSFHYVCALKINFKTILPTIISGFLFSVIGAKIVSGLGDEILKPIIFIMLVLIGLYTFFKKNFGLHSQKKLAGMNLQLVSMLIAAVMGFYDGFFGPGTGSLLMFFFVGLLGYSFLEGAALSKLTNLSANVAALLFFIFNHHVYYAAGIPMAVFNILGNSVGSKLAIKKGSGFVRWVFLIVIAAIIIQFIYQSGYI